MAHRRQAILVLGMHRSGTSALTRALALRGAALPATLMAPAADNNETGFWEPESLVALHDEVLAAMGSAWDDMRTLPAGWFDGARAAAFHRRLSDLLDAEYGEASTILVKDPRLCRLVGLWLPVLAEKGIEPLVVVPVRHPLEVAASLQQREGFEAPRAIQLWLSYVLAAERDTRGLRRCFVTYDDLLADWRAVIRRIGSVLDIDWSGDEQDAAGAIDAFLSASWRHHALPEAALDAAPPWLGQTYRWMRQAASGAAPALGLLDEIGAGIAAAEAIFGPAIGALQNEIVRKGAETTHWVSAAVERYEVIEGQRREIERLGLLVEEKGSTSFFVKKEAKKLLLAGLSRFKRQEPN